MAQGEITIGRSGADHYGWLGHAFSGVHVAALSGFSVGQALIHTSIADVAYSGDEKAGWRCCIGITFWGLSAAFMFAVFLFSIVPMTGVDLGWIGERNAIILLALAVTQLLYSIVFVYVAHKAMREVSHPVASRHAMSVSNEMYTHALRWCTSTLHYKRSLRLS